MESLERGILPIPLSFSESKESVYTAIFFFSGSDTEGEARRKLKVEWDSVPLVNLKYGENSPGASDLRHQLILVYITDFFPDETDFVYAIRAEDRSKFLHGMFSGKAYDRPCFATPITVFTYEKIFDSRGLQQIHMERTSRTDTKGLKWKYFYESGLKAWEQMELSQEKLDAIKISKEQAIAVWKAEKDRDKQASQSSPRLSSEDEKKADVRSDYEEGMRDDELSKDVEIAEDGPDDGSNHDDGKDKDVIMS